MVTNQNCRRKKYYFRKTFLFLKLAVPMMRNQISWWPYTNTYLVEHRQKSLVPNLVQIASSDTEMMSLTILCYKNLGDIAVCSSN